MDITINKAHIDFKDKIDTLFNEIRNSFNQKYYEKMEELTNREETIVEKEKAINKFRKQSLLASMDRQVMEKTKEIKFLKIQLEKSKKKSSSKSNNSKELEKLKKDLDEKNKIIEKLTQEKEKSDSKIIELNNKIKSLQKIKQESDSIVKYSNDTEEEEKNEDDNIWSDIKIKNRRYILNNETKKVYESSDNGKTKKWIGRLTSRGTFKRK